MAATVTPKVAVQISANAAQFGSALAKASKDLNAFTKGVNTMKKGLIAAFAFDKIMDLGKQIVDLTAQFQRFEAILTNTLGSNSAAKKALDDIRKFAAETPFEVSELSAAYVRWANQGLAPTIDKMRMLGDVASSLGAGFEQTAEAFKDLAVGQTKRIEEIGISAQQANGKIQLSFKGVNLEIEKNAEGVNKALATYSQLQGVLGTSASIAATTGGKLSNLTDNLSNLGVTLGDRSKGLINGFLDFANNAIGGLNAALNVQSEKLMRERLELNILVSAITNVNTSTEARKKLLNDLNIQYPDFLKNLEIEKVTNEELKKRMDDVNKQFLRKIALAAAEEKLIEVQKDLNDAIDDEAEALKDAFEAREAIEKFEQKKNLTQRERSRKITLAIGQEKIALDDAKNAREEQNELQQKLIELTNRYTKQLDVTNSVSNDYFDSVNAGNQSVNSGTEEITKQMSDAWNEHYKKITKGAEIAYQGILAQEMQAAGLGKKKPFESILALPDTSKQKDPYGISLFVESLRPMINGLNQVQKASLSVKDRIVQDVANINQAFKDAATAGLTDFFMGFEQVAQKEISFGDNVLRAIASFMKTFGQYMIQLGVAKLGFDKLITNLAVPNPAIAIGAIAAGTALVALGGAIQKNINARMQARAEAATAAGRSAETGRTSNTTRVEISGQLVGSGRDLVAVINNTNYDNKIRKGG